jgi:hypothetical protein
MRLGVALLAAAAVAGCGGRCAGPIFSPQGSVVGLPNSSWSK